MWTNLVGPTSWMLPTKSQGLCIWRRFLKGFYHIRAWRPSWSCNKDHLSKLSFPYPKESPNEILVQLARFQRRRCLKMFTDGRQSHWYTNSSPRSLRLRWANNMDPDQAAVFWSGLMFASIIKFSLNCIWIYAEEKSRHLQYICSGRIWANVQFL